MKAVLPGLFSRCLVPDGLFRRAIALGVVRVVADELEVLGDLTPLFNLAHVSPAVIDRQREGATCCCDFLAVDNFNFHQQGERATLFIATEVVAREQLTPIPPNKKVGRDVLDVKGHVSEKER